MVILKQCTHVAEIYINDVINSGDYKCVHAHEIILFDLRIYNLSSHLLVSSNCQCTTWFVPL